MSAGTRASTAPESGPGTNEPLLTENEAARLLRLKPRTLQAWRLVGGKGLPFVRISRRAVRYRMVDLRRFVRRKLRLSTSDPGGNFDEQREGGRHDSQL